MPSLVRARILLSHLAVGAGSALAQSALYDAGTAGNPPVAPSPETQGWFLFDGGGGVGLEPISPDGNSGLNAWEINDSVSMPDGWAYYCVLSDEFDLPYLASTWEITATMRMTAGPDPAISFGIDSGGTIGDSHYELHFEIAGADVVACHLSSGQSYICVGAAGEVHTYTIRKTIPGAYQPAEFLFDGVPLGPVPEQIYTNWGSCVFFGARSGPDLGRTRVHRVELRLLDDLGERYCSPAEDNSTGVPAILEAAGSPYVNQGFLTLTASRLPPGEFGYFLASRTQGYSMPPGSQGFLCLSGDVGRFNEPGQIVTGPVGVLDVDLANIPVHPPGPVQPGETWNFQCWFRDAGSSNFTDAIEIEFR